jgi:tRNA A37 threonylcarbamoyladenosine dehydratase
MTEAFPRYGLMKQLYGAEQYEKIIQSKILVVGAGGIGCEVS